MPEEGDRGPIEDGWNCDGEEDFPGACPGCCGKGAAEVVL